MMIKVNESWYIELFVSNRSIKRLLSNACVNIYFFQSIVFVNICLLSIFFFDRFYPVEKCGGTPYRDALTLSKGNPQSDFEFDVLTRYKRQTILNWHN